MIAIEVRNVDRSAVSVEQWGLSLPFAHVQLVSIEREPWMGPTVPFTLEGGHAKTWYFPLGEVKRALVASHISEGKVFGVASLGTGKQITAKKGVLVRL